MQRRSFLQKLISATAIAMASGATVVYLNGCAFSIEDAINTILNSALAILKVATPNAPWVPQLAQAIAALEQAETQWKAGGAAAIVIDALNTIEAVLAVVPATAQIAPLIAILFAGIEAVMSAFGLSVQLPPAASAKRGRIVNSPYYNRVQLNHPGLAHPTWQGAYKAQWNAECDKINLAAAKL